MAVEHVLGMLVAGHTRESILEDFPWKEREDIQACLLYATRMVGNERLEPVLAEAATLCPAAGGHISTFDN